MADDLGFDTRIKIGTTKYNMQSVKVEPVVTFIQNSELTVTGYGKGTPLECLWEYPDRLLEGDQYKQLKDLVGEEASANVIIDIPVHDVDPVTFDPVVATYQAIMQWPEAESIRIISKNRWEIDGIRFTGLRPLD